MSNVDEILMALDAHKKEMIKSLETFNDKVTELHAEIKEMAAKIIEKLPVP